MSKAKLNSGLSHLAIALLVAPLVIGGIAYAAINPLAMGNTVTGVTHSSSSPSPTGYGVQDRQMLREHCENKTTVTIEGTVVNVSAGTGEKATVTVREDNGKVITALIGGRWMDSNKTLLTPQELASKMNIGDHVIITAFIACDGDLRATGVNVTGTTYTLLHGPSAHGFHGCDGGETHGYRHHGSCNCGEHHND